MYSFLKSIFLLLIITKIGSCTRVRRLAGGANSEINQFPYMAAIKYKDSLVCGGAIIAQDKILTAANCIDKCLIAKSSEYYRDCDKYMTVITGTSTLSKGGNTHRIKSVKIPETFVIGKFANDIGIITIESQIKYNENEKPINLPGKDISENIIATTTGWGSKVEPRSLEERFSDKLQNLKQMVLLTDKCNKLFNDSKTQVDINDFCATSLSEKAGLCAGDSGNPLIQDGKIIGISTWGIGCDGKYPDVYTNVYKYLSFIKNELI